MIGAEQHIRTLVQDRIESTRARDAEGATRDFAHDVRIFDVVNPLRHQGLDSVKRRAQEWFSSFNGPIDFDVTDLHVAVGEHVAFTYALNHVHGQTAAGTLDMWWRSTTCFRNVDGKWKIVHEHNSVPFDPATGRASLDLQP